jgi:ABC-type transporter Mla MlaB component
MFRITSHTNDDEFVLKLEGCLEGEAVRELHGCWRDASRISGRRVRVDLREVCHIDDAGVELMMVMYRAGSRFMTKGCFMPELVREISEAIGGTFAAEALGVNAGARS